MYFTLCDHSGKDLWYLRGQVYQTRTGYTDFLNGEGEGVSIRPSMEERHGVCTVYVRRRPGNVNDKEAEVY